MRATTDTEMQVTSSPNQTCDVACGSCRTICVMACTAIGFQCPSCRSKRDFRRCHACSSVQQFPIKTGAFVCALCGAKTRPPLGRPWPGVHAEIYAIEVASRRLSPAAVLRSCTLVGGYNMGFAIGERCYLDMSEDQVTVGTTDGPVWRAAVSDLVQLDVSGPGLTKRGGGF